MKSDDIIKEKMQELAILIAEWQKCIDFMGNQTAYSDRILEDVLKTVEEIKTKFDEQFD